VWQREKDSNHRREERLMEDKRRALEALSEEHDRAVRMMETAHRRAEAEWTRERQRLERAVADEVGVEQ
jgi:hypothetical protein